MERVARLLQLLPQRTAMASNRFNSCAVVGSSPELLLYEDGAAIDAHEAVFRANLAVVDGFEAHAGRRTTVRVINPVESARRARLKGSPVDRERTVVIKNQDPPAIRSPSREHSKFVDESEKEARAAVTPPANYLARRIVLELCNYLMLASLDADAASGHVDAAAVRASLGGKGGGKESKRSAAAAVNFSATTAAFRAYLSGAAKTWHPGGDKIPKFSPAHCSTGTVLLLQALLTCRKVALYGYHACTCQTRCSAPAIAQRNHYWDKKETPHFDAMFARYESHMRLYQRLESACDVDFRIARRDHCDRQ